MRKAKTVDAYIAAAPKEVRRKLKQLRAAIRSVAPDAEERISYGMPYYGYKGRLAYFRHWKNYIGLYIPTPVVEEHARELGDLVAARATVHFPLDGKLPLSVIKKLVRSRMRKNQKGK